MVKIRMSSFIINKYIQIKYNTLKAQSMTMITQRAEERPVSLQTDPVLRCPSVSRVALAVFNTNSNTFKELTADLYKQEAHLRL